MKWSARETYTCPSCGSEWFGTIRLVGNQQFIRCGDEHKNGCRTIWRLTFSDATVTDKRVVSEQEMRSTCFPPKN